MIEYIKSDLFKSDCSVIVHGCNCQGVMGSGVAKIVREQYPEAFIEYKNYLSFHGKNVLGDISPVYIKNKNMFVINAFTQYEYGIHKRQVSYDAVDNVMEKISLWSKFGDNVKDSIAMPKIGAGLGGGEWTIIESIINYRLKDIKVKVYEL